MEAEESFPPLPHWLFAYLQAWPQEAMTTGLEIQSVEMGQHCQILRPRAGQG